MYTTTAIIALLACNAAQFALGVYGIRKWHRWKLRADEYMHEAKCEKQRASHLYKQVIFAQDQHLQANAELETLRAKDDQRREWSRKGAAVTNSKRRAK